MYTEDVIFSNIIMITQFSDTKYIMLKSLGNMKEILVKVEKQMHETSKQESEILDGRLAPDMFTLSKQIQIMSDNAKGAIGRLSDVTPPVMEDKETSIAELLQRLEKTMDFLNSVSDETINSCEEKITMSYIPNKYQERLDYVRDFALSNFFFHYSMAYAILRMLGFEIGKMDYIGALTLHDIDK